MWVIHPPRIIGDREWCISESRHWSAAYTSLIEVRVDLPHSAHPIFYQCNQTTIHQSVRGFLRMSRIKTKPAWHGHWYIIVMPAVYSYTAILAASMTGSFRLHAFIFLGLSQSQVQELDHLLSGEIWENVNFGGDKWINPKIVTSCRVNTYRDIWRFGYSATTQTVLNTCTCTCTSI